MAQTMYHINISLVPNRNLLSMMTLLPHLEYALAIVLFYVLFKKELNNKYDLYLISILIIFVYQEMIVLCLLEFISKP